MTDELIERVVIQALDKDKLEFGRMYAIWEAIPELFEAQLNEHQRSLLAGCLSLIAPREIEENDFVVEMSREVLKTFGTHSEAGVSTLVGTSPKQFTEIKIKPAKGKKRNLGPLFSEVSYDRDADMMLFIFHEALSKAPHVLEEIRKQVPALVKPNTNAND